MLDDIDPNLIEDPVVRQIVVRLLQSAEHQHEIIAALLEENRLLKDEIARLKGQHGKPQIKSNVPVTDHSSEAQRKQPKIWTKQPKKHLIAINRTRVLELDRTDLPPDIEFKGYEDYVVQDLKLECDNILFQRAKYYSPSTGKTYLANLPPGYTGHFGPGSRSLALWLAYSGNMSHADIHALFANAGLHISTGKVCQLLVEGQADFHTESADVLMAGVASSPWHHLDDTLTRVNGQNQHCYTLCNPLYSAYDTRAGKDRLSVLQVLTAGRPLAYLCNCEALAYMQAMKLSAKMRKCVEAVFSQKGVLSEEELGCVLASCLPNLGQKQLKTLREGMAIAAHHAQTGLPVIDLLISDAAPQFEHLACEQALCWIHDGRHYAKLTPNLACFRRRLAGFMTQYWDYYKQLLAYKERPCTEEASRLRTQFDSLFVANTGYHALDDRIQKTRACKEKLLMVLHHPEIPLHNNPAELAVRRRVRKRDVSFGPRSEDGKRAWDTFMTLSETAKKHGVSFYHYLYDRLARTDKMPPLASLIRERAAQLRLGKSFEFG